MFTLTYFEKLVLRALLALIVLSWAMCAFFHFPSAAYVVVPAMSCVVFGLLRSAQYPPGHREIEAGDWKSAIEICEKQLVIKPDDESAHMNYALALSNTGRFEKSVEEFSRAIELNSKAKSYYVMRAVASQSLNNYRDSLNDLSKAIELGYEGPVPQSLRLRALIYDYQFEKALEQIDFIRKKFPKFKDVDLYHAELLHSMYRDEEANKLCSDVFPKLPKASLTYAKYVRSLTSAGLGQLDAAIDDMQQLIPLMNLTPLCYFHLASFYLQKGDLERAQSSLDQAKPQRAYEESMLAMYSSKLCIIKGDDKGALMLAERAFEEFSQHPDVQAILGLALLKNGKYEEAQQKLDQAITINPYCAEAFFYRGELYEKLGDAEKAAEDHQVASNFGFKPYL